ncbi:SGNH/GDSL hydrolase family protein [Ancylobacter radicis]|uniref:SGNH/GDSL hydrolase family protein n=1 Tax=Ancylobacter radicis TaxID=2836179 RepID=A0ABS5R1V7_9HYPH|nr:SGNH/GDSL hydrolase family protein [Ancylobacter radicis]MBS9475601.1 SGNH/GDSL hydrolase family protein [Ancylobacter radicis]
MRRTALTAAAILPLLALPLLALPAGAQSLGGQTLGGQPLLSAPTCPAPKVATRLTQPLARTAARLRAGETVVIVAIGSSSTAGAGASTPEGSYPSRLQALLRERFPQADITVLNRGVNGQDAPEMLARFDTDVAAAQPTLVIWQAGVNALFRDNGLSTAEGQLREAIARVRAIHADLLLVDPQYSPRVLADADTAPMIRMIDTIAAEQGVGVYHRFALMREWHETAGMPFESFLWKDGFHMNDWSYNCLARDLGRAMIANIDSQQRSADMTSPKAAASAAAGAGGAVPASIAAPTATLAP